MPKLIFLQDIKRFQLTDNDNSWKEMIASSKYSVYR